MKLSRGDGMLPVSSRVGSTDITSRRSGGRCLRKMFTL